MLASDRPLRSKLAWRNSPPKLGAQRPSMRRKRLEHLDEMEDKYLAINNLENPGKRWALNEIEQDLDLER